MVTVIVSGSPGPKCFTGLLVPSAVANSGGVSVEIVGDIYDMPIGTRSGIWGENKTASVIASMIADMIAMITGIVLVRGLVATDNGL